MIRSAKYGAVLTALALTCLLFKSNAQPAVDSTLFADPVVAKGKGFEIKRDRVDEAYVIYKANAAAHNQEIPDDKRDMITSNLLQRIILTEILLSKATPDDKAKGKSETDKFLADAKKQFPTEDAFMMQIRTTGMSLDQFKARAMEQNICEAVLDRDVKSKINISDDVVKKFYEDNPSKFEQPEQVRASHILISTLDPVTQEPLPTEKKKEKEKLIRDIRARAEKGEDFAALAKQYSDDPGSKDRGGEYTFPRGQMVKEFETAAFTLQTNQISDVVETRFGYHIIKLSEKIPATKITLAKASPDIKDYLVNQEFKKQLDPYLEKIKADASVQLITPGAASGK